jgi:hypothetical protein
MSTCTGLKQRSGIVDRFHISHGLSGHIGRRRTESPGTRFLSVDISHPYIRGYQAVAFSASRMCQAMQGDKNLSPGCQGVESLYTTQEHVAEQLGTIQVPF